MAAAFSFSFLDIPEAAELIFTEMRIKNGK
jgi:hypothetical protein